MLNSQMGLRLCVRFAYNITRQLLINQSGLIAPWLWYISNQHYSQHKRNSSDLKLATGLA